MIQVILWILVVELFLLVAYLAYLLCDIFSNILAIVLENIEDFIKTKV